MHKYINNSQVSTDFTEARTTITNSREPVWFKKLTAPLNKECERVERFAEIHRLKDKGETVPERLKNDLDDYECLLSDLSKDDQIGLASVLYDDIAVNFCYNGLENNYDVTLWKLGKKYGIEITRGTEIIGCLGLGCIVKNNNSFVKVAKLNSSHIDKFKN